MVLALFKYTQITFIAMVLGLYHMYNGIMHKFSEWKVKLPCVNISAASTSASFLWYKIVSETAKLWGVLILILPL